MQTPFKRKADGLGDATAHGANKKNTPVTQSKLTKSAAGLKVANVNIKSRAAADKSAAKKPAAKANPFLSMMSAAKKKGAFDAVPKAKSTAANTTLAASVRPDKVLVKPQAMFDQLTEGYPEFAEFCEKLGRPLRVATMCSGTESPLLALNMISSSVMKQTGCELQIDHVFSCEIEVPVLTLAVSHSHCLTLAVSLSMCHSRCFTLEVSLSLCHSRCFTLDVSLSMSHSHCLTLDVSLSLCRSRCVTLDVSPSMSHPRCWLRCCSLVQLSCRAVVQSSSCVVVVQQALSVVVVLQPFKQAYIERNFSPPLLFRDIRELGNDQATTAYGGLADVPGDCDILVAGTSCVDYSTLNNDKKGLDAGVRECLNCRVNDAEWLVQSG